MFGNKVKLLLTFGIMVLFMGLIPNAFAKEKTYQYIGTILNPVFINKESGVYKFNGNTNEINDKFTIDNFIEFADTLKPLNMDGNKFKKISITNNKDNSFINYFKVDATSGYLRETIYTCINNNGIIYTKSNDTDMQWKETKPNGGCVNME